jgi:isoleucyl-tRNA synthetase
VTEPKDYKSTINLPDTGFPMQAGLAKREPESLARWQGDGLYAQVQAATAGRPPFWLVDGPPYANGDIHIGHAVNKVLKDIVCKSARLEGYHVPFVPGWDCHGLPIELQVEKKFGKVGEKLDAHQFRQKCREYAQEQVARQREDFKRLGVLADWEHPYLTMAPAFEAEQLRVLARIIDNGHVVRGFKPVHWCLDCGSSLAEAEVEYEDKKSFAIDVKFAAADAADLARRFGVDDALGAAFVIWTTTPWTLPANQGIAVGADIEYVLADFPAQGRVVVAAELLPALARRFGAEPAVRARVPGGRLEGAAACHPFAGRTVPVILGQHVTLEAGTGLVHTAPAHGVEDYVVGQQYGLPVDNPVLSSGRFSEATPLVGGLHVRKADEPIVAALRESGALAHLAEITHSYPHCWRHKTPLIFRATPQWFISMEATGLRAKALAAIRKTHWIPAWGEARIHEMVKDRPDWCISRQRTWGVPLAVFVDREAQTLHPESAALLRRIADRVDAEGLEAWWRSTPSDWGVDELRYEKCLDTLDVWFDSGVVHQCFFKANGFAVPDYAALDSTANRDPASGKNGATSTVFYLEGSDQHRGWFHSSLLARVATDGHPPYTHVLTHGFTVDEQGRKMSKSLGNVVAPQQVTKTLGADILRLWAASSDYSGEIAISDKLLARMADAYRRIRNTARYLLGNLQGFDPPVDEVAPADLLAMDRWALQQASRLQDEIRAAYGRREFHLVYHKLHNYCVVDLGGLYLDVLKDRLYTLPRRSLARRSAQTAMFHIAEAMVRWIAPVLSFTADEIWQQLPGQRSVPLFAQTWHRLPEVAADELDWERLSLVREAVKKVLEELRIGGQIGSGLNAAVALYADGELASAIRAPGEELRFWFITSDVRVDSGAARTDSATEALLANGEKLWIAAAPTSSAKCERCWHQRPEVGSRPAHPTLCDRCIGNIEGVGEMRRYI